MLLCVALPALILKRGGSSLSYERVEMYFHQSGRSELMSLEEYTAHVCAAYADESWEDEALCALAIAVRTRALLYKGAHCSHDFCDGLAESMPYSEGVPEKVLLATEETASLVLVHEGALVPAFIHKSSYLVTESAFNALGKEHPCIVSVSSPERVEGVERLVTHEEFALVMQVKLDVEDYQITDLPECTKNNTGRLGSVSVRGVHIDGEDFASAFGLPSSCAELERRDEGYLITTYGEGSGLGMSLAGARTMASEGRTFDEILTHYYRGTTVVEVYKILK